MDFVTATSADNWFKKHPEKIAGIEYETTSFYFPIMVKGTKEDVLRVTGMSKEKVAEHIENFNIKVNGTIYTKYDSIRQTENQFKEINLIGFLDLLDEAKKLAGIKIKLIKSNKATVVDSNSDSYFVKQGNTNAIIDKDEDFSKSKIAYNLFTAIHDFLQTKKLFDYDFQQHKQAMQLQSNYLNAVITDAEYFDKEQPNKKLALAKAKAKALKIKLKLQ